MKKLVLVAAATATFIGFGAVPSSANGISWYINPQLGFDQTSCGGPNGGGGAQPNQGAGGPSSGPCLTLNQALANGTPGDNFFIQEGGTFGPIVLTGNVAINGPEDRSVVIEFLPSTLPGCLGTTAGTCNGNADATYAIDINPNASSNVTVKLKNIIVNEAAGTNASLHIGNAFNTSLTQVTLRGPNVTSSLLFMNPSLLGSNGQAQLYMSNCDVGFSNAGGGVDVVPSGATPTYVHMHNTEVHNMKYGAKFDASSMSGDALSVEVESSEFFAFNGSAIAANGTGSGFAHVALSRSAVLDSNQAVNVNGANASLILYEDVIIGNGIGVNITSSEGAGSAGNNLIYANGNGTANCEVNGSPSSSCSGILGTVGTQ